MIGVTGVLDALEHARRSMGYRLPRPVSWLVRGLNVLHACQVEAELFPGIRVPLDLTDDGQRAAFWMGRDYERPTPQILEGWCSAQGSVFFDIGANFGFYSYLVLSACPGAPVYSFEPNPMHRAVHTTVKKNHCLERYHPEPFALGDVTTELELRKAKGKHDSGHFTFGEIGPADLETSLKAKVRVFDEWVQDAGLTYPATPAWIAKIDVEGFEPNVLRGMQRSLQARAFRGLCIEVNDFALHGTGNARQAIYDWMASFGYQAYDDLLRPTAPIPGELRNVFFRPREGSQS